MPGGAGFALLALVAFGRLFCLSSGMLGCLSRFARGLALGQASLPSLAYRQALRLLAQKLGVIGVDLGSKPLQQRLLGGRRCTSPLIEIRLLKDSHMSPSRRDSLRTTSTGVSAPSVRRNE